MKDHFIDLILHFLFFNVSIVESSATSWLSMFVWVVQWPILLVVRISSSWRRIFVSASVSLFIVSASVSLFIVIVLFIFSFLQRIVLFRPRVILIWSLFLKFVTQSVFHGWVVLDWSHMLFEIKSSWIWIKLQKMSHLVGNHGSGLFFLRIFEPNLKKLIFLAKRKTDTNDIRFIELFSDDWKHKRFPHQINIFVKLKFGDPDSTLWTFFPHWHLTVFEKEKVHFFWQRRNSFKENFKIEKLF